MMRNLKKFLLKNPVRRGMALILAVLFYVQLDMQVQKNKDTTSYDVPVTVILHDGLKKAYVENPAVTVKLHLPRNYSVRPGTVEIRAVVSEKNYRKAYDDYQVEISRQNVTITDSKITFAGFGAGKNPVLSLNLMRTVSREIPVRLLFSGNAPFGAVAKGNCLPKKVRVTGPENIVKDLQDLSSVPIPLDGAPDGFEYETGLQLPSGVKAVPSRVRVRVKLESTSTRRIYGLPVRILNAPEGKAEFVNPLKNGAAVTLRGSSAILSRLTPSKITVFADAAEFSSAGRRRVKLHCFIEYPGITVTELVPGEVELKLTK